MPRPRKAPTAVGEQSPMTDVQTLEGAQVEQKPARKFAKEVNTVPVEDPKVTVRVTERGADRMSTGKHVAVLGDELYRLGETFKVERSIAEALAYGPDGKADTPRDKWRSWVEILG